MKLAIGILTHNHPEISFRCLQSVCEWIEVQTLNKTKIKCIEIFILHNGSLAKNSDQLVASSSKLTQNVQHFFLKNNAGYTAGANECFKIAFHTLASDWLLFLTNDTQLLELDLNIFNELYLPNTEKPTIQVIAPLVLSRKGTKVDSIGGCFNTRQGKLSHLKKIDSKLNAKDHFYVPGSAFFVHKSVYDSSVLFNERLHTYWEDVDWSMRLKVNQIQMGTSSKVKVHHLIGKTCHKKSYFTLHLFQRNRILVSLEYSETKALTALFILYSWTKLSLSLIKTKRFKDLSFLSSAFYISSLKRKPFLYLKESK